MWYQSVKVMTVLSIFERISCAQIDLGERLTIIDVVQVSMRVIGVVHNDGSPETITVLCGKVAVVPEGAYIVIMLDKQQLIIAYIGAAYQPDQGPGSHRGKSCRWRWDTGSRTQVRQPSWCPSGRNRASAEKAQRSVGAGNACNGELTMLVVFNIVWLVIWSMTFNWKRSP